jgi:hypothetical protein
VPARVSAVARALGADVVLRLHRHLANVLVAAVAAHVALVILAEPANVALLDPLGAPWRAKAAVAACAALAAPIASSLLRARLRLAYARWRGMHVVLGSSGWGNAELQEYTDAASNAALDGRGNLAIVARYEGGRYTSARLKTQDRYTQRYGRIEARIRIPEGKGIWPASWMLGENLGEVGWPSSGEIDIMENVGHEPSVVHGSLHGPGFSAGTA